MVNKTDELTESDIELTGEDNPDDTQLVEEEENSKDKISSLKAKLKTCEKEKAQALEDLQRTKADFLNSRKRLEEQAEQQTERNLNQFLVSLLPLCDSFDMAVADKKTWDAVDENWRKGIEGIISQLSSVLKKHGVTAIEAKGLHFDPVKHEAVSSIDGDGESDTVIEVLQKGYERNGEVIRPAKVIIQN